MSVRLSGGVRAGESVSCKAPPPPLLLLMMMKWRKRRKDRKCRGGKSPDLQFSRHFHVVGVFRSVNSERGDEFTPDDGATAGTLVLSGTVCSQSPASV